MQYLCQNSFHKKYLLIIQNFEYLRVFKRVRIKLLGGANVLDRYMRSKPFL